MSMATTSIPKSIPNAGSTAGTGAGHPTVTRFLDQIASGSGVGPELFDPAAVLDATVPDWRFSVRGPDALARQYSGWFNYPATFEELQRHAVTGGELVTYLLTWTENGVPHAAHHCHVFTLAGDGRILRDLAFCGGRWDAARLAEMAAAQEG